MSGLRGLDGLDLHALSARTGFAPSERALDPLVSGGLVSWQAGRLALTEAGVPVADGVVRHLSAHLAPVR